MHRSVETRDLFPYRTTSAGHTITGGGKEAAMMTNGMSTSDLELRNAALIRLRKKREFPRVP